MAQLNPALLLLFLFTFSSIGNTSQASYTQGFRGKSAFNPFEIPDGQNYLTAPEWAGDYASEFISEVLGFGIWSVYVDKDDPRYPAFNQNLTEIILELEKGVYSDGRDTPLLISYEWFKTHLNSTSYPEAELKNILEKSVFMVGQIAGDNYKKAFFVERKSIQEATNLVPSVVKSITDEVRDAINIGAVRIVVPGNLPLGSLQDYLVRFETRDSKSYDQDQGLKSFNKFARYHNSYLQDALRQLRKNDIVVLYADYYTTCLFNSRIDRLYM